jgi:outer membrane protein assembly factor BamB
VIGDGVYFGDDDGKLHAVDAATGKLRWVFETADQVISSAIPLPEQRVVFGSYDGFVYCLNAGDGKLAWKFETAGKVHGTPALTSDAARLIVAGCDEHIYVLDARTGRELTKIAAGSPSGSSPAIAAERAFVGTYGQQVLGLEWQKPEVLWRFEDPERQFPYASSAGLVLDAKGVAAAVVIGGRDKRLRCLEARSGKPRWEFVARGRIDSSPVIVGQRIFVGASDGNLYAINAADGRETWRYEAGGAITASPAIAAGRLVIGTEDGALYCFGPEPGPAHSAP